MSGRTWETGICWFVDGIICGIQRAPSIKQEKHWDYVIFCLTMVRNASEMSMSPVFKTLCTEANSHRHISYSISLALPMFGYLYFFRWEVSNECSPTRFPGGLWFGEDLRVVVVLQPEFEANEVAGRMTAFLNMILNKTRPHRRAWGTGGHRMGFKSPSRPFSWQQPAWNWCAVDECHKDWWSQWSKYIQHLQDWCRTLSTAAQVWKWWAHASRQSFNHG